MLRTVIFLFPAIHLALTAPLDCVCGKEGAAKRIINGAAVQHGKYPWMVAVVIPHEDGTGVAAFCGGTVINNEWILTAAHCIPGRKPSELLIVRSTVNILAAESNKKMYVDQIWSHPEYIGKADWFRNDIALLHLTEPITFSNEISPVCLPTKEMKHFNNLFDMGWGRTSTSDQSLTQLLYMDTNQTDACIEVYKHFNFWDKQVCTYAEGKGICLGDSGGPLSSRSNGYVTQVGINSWGPSICGKHPDVTTRVSEYLDDIAAITAGSSWCRNPNLGE